MRAKHLNLFVMILVMLVSTSVTAKTIFCTAERIGTTFKINTNSVVFQDMDQVDSGRSIASINSVRTKNYQKGFTKILKHEGQKYLLHVENSSSFSTIDDYLTIRSNKGHEIIYPISCQ